MPIRFASAILFASSCLVLLANCDSPTTNSAEPSATAFNAEPATETPSSQPPQNNSPSDDSTTPDSPPSESDESNESENSNETDSPNYTCPEDDIFEENNTPDTATQISSGTIYHAVACWAENEPNPNEDLFALRVDEGCHITVNLRFVHSHGDLDVTLFTRNAESLGDGGNSNTDNETITYLAANSNEYFVRITPVETSGNQYTLEVALTCS